MSALVLQPSFPTRARRRHVVLVPAQARSRRPLRAARPVPVPPTTTVPAPLHVTRRGRLAMSASVLLVVGGVALWVVGAAVPAAVRAPAPPAPAPAAASPAAPATAEVVVLPGDTLWSLADEAAAPGEDLRDVVLRIEEINDLASAHLVVGDRLLVPA